MRFWKRATRRGLVFSALILLLNLGPGEAQAQSGNEFAGKSWTELQQALATADGKKPTQRLITAIAYKHGVTQTELAEWYGVHYLLANTVGIGVAALGADTVASVHRTVRELAL